MLPSGRVHNPALNLTTTARTLKRRMFLGAIRRWQRRSSRNTLGIETDLLAGRMAGSIAFYLSSATVNLEWRRVSTLPAAGRF